MRLVKLVNYGLDVLELKGHVGEGMVKVPSV